MGSPCVRMFLTFFLENTGELRFIILILRRKKGGKETPYNTHHTTPTCQNYIRACGNIEATKARLSLGYKTTGGVVEPRMIAPRTEGICSRRNPEGCSQTSSEEVSEMMPWRKHKVIIRGALKEASWVRRQQVPQGEHETLGKFEMATQWGKRSRHPNPTALVKVQHSRETHEMEEGATCLNQIRIGFRCKHVLKGPKSP